MKILKRVLKNLFIKILYFIYTLLIKNKIKDKKTIPHNYVYELYETYISNENQSLVNKIIIPYELVDDFNRHDLNRSFEILPAEVSSANNYELNICKEREIILPIAILDKENVHKSEVVTLKFGNIKEINIKYKNRFHYLPLKDSNEFNKINITSSSLPFAVGDPISSKHSSIESTKSLVVHIFIDALSKSALDIFGIDVMPNTRDFFSDGTIYENAYSQADWTLSSMSGVFTGKYTKDHMIYHPRRCDKISTNSLAETLNSNGYFSTMISSIPKITPLNGFDRGFNRSIIAPNKDASYIINEVKEQLDAFNGNQYLFVGFFDIHEAFMLQPISSQLKNKLKDFNYKDMSQSKGLEILYDNERLARYKNSLKHLDSKLLQLYQEIEAYDKDALVVMHSDHGVDFITTNTQRLSKERQKVPLMIKGRNIEKICKNSIQEIREIPSIVLNSLKIENEFQDDSSNLCISESIYPNQEYELAIRDQDYVLFFQVPWISLKNKLRSDINYISSFHFHDDESIEVTKNSRYDFMLDAAISHYNSLISNLEKFEAKN